MRYSEEKKKVHLLIGLGMLVLMALFIFIAQSSKNKYTLKSSAAESDNTTGKFYMCLHNN